MSPEPANVPQCSHGLPRRMFLGGMGALALAGMTDIGSAGAAATPSRAAPSDSFPAQPNIVVIITDQERRPMYWPAGWAERNLPHRQRIARHGLTFDQAVCNTAMCSPSRSTFFTGLYPAQHGVTRTLTEGGTVSPTEPQLQTSEQNMAKMLASAGYNVQYRGKWHLSKGASGGDPSSDDVAAFGFGGWTPPDAGQDTNPDHFGGGCADHDRRAAEEAVEFLTGPDARGDKPFALIVSFVNPHDVLAYPQSWDAMSGTCDNYGSDAPGAFEQGIELPPTYDEILAFNYKPSAQVQSELLLAAGLGPLLGPDQARKYINFYAYMHKVVDERIGSVLDALEATPGLLDDTVIVRMSDHGEMGMSHGGLRQKVFNAYEETLRIPLVISNPLLFPQPVQTDALASLIDVMPTLANLAQVPDRASWNFLGTDLTPVLVDAAAYPNAPSMQVQDTILFTYDDQNCATPDGQNIVRAPNHIRCIRDSRWKYTMYFDPAGSAAPQYELYDLNADPLETNNLANPFNSESYQPAKAAEMNAKLFAAMDAKGVSLAESSNIPQN
ncbi:sulfatase-like hydrolase/transferase [Rhodococcus sp. KBS0724]|uniref:sulfatase-like hydrolase/transferase n=1 Tax=Rhodococcus sp. KBS0724 TaxID=1179674 RepID=UPI00110D5B19|nr:sulfatase-like hydrolase/transferase [Rhodococcus sp. KBS0724]TSD48296.1 sulfatase-like hydrolase/transferase [Rhodococcus sp. KBS0724]